MHLRMLAHIERLQMQAAGARLNQQRIEQHLRQPDALVLSQAVAQQLQVFNELLCARIGIQGLLRQRRDAVLRHATQPDNHEGNHQT